MPRVLVGVVLWTAWMPDAHCIPSIAFSTKILLEIAVVMFGAQGRHRYRSGARGHFCPLASRP